MEKTVNDPRYKMRMNIELAENGIIIRNLDCEGEVTLAMEKFDTNDHLDRSDSYQLIGMKIYSWLMDISIQERADFTKFDLEVIATCKWRPMP